MAKKTDAQITEHVREIGRMLSAGMIDREIMEKLNLKRASYYAYRKRLYRESGELFKQTNADELLYHRDLLQERLTRMYRQVETDLNNSELSNKDRAALYMAAQSLSMNIFRLNYEGMIALKNAYGNQGRPALSAINTTVRSESNIGSGSGVIRLLQTEEPGGTSESTGQEKSDITPAIPIEKQEPDESEVY